MVWGMIYESGSMRPGDGRFALGRAGPGLGRGWAGADLGLNMIMIFAHRAVKAWGPGT